MQRKSVFGSQMPEPMWSIEKADRKLQNNRIAKKRPSLRGYIAWSSWMLLFFCCQCSLGQAQNLRNEWIDYNKTYYRFAVVPSVSIIGTPGTHVNTADYNKLQRISYAALQSLGLENTPAQHFQLWRNGKEVPIYTSQPIGTLSSDDFIEFWGRCNDGTTDKDLYRLPINQTNDRWSMFSDTAYYYLTVNESSTNLRITEAVHDPLGSILQPDSFFLHTLQINPRATRSLGFALNISATEVRSSSWDAGEGWGEARFGGTPFTIGLGNLFAFRNTNATINTSFWAQGTTNRNQIIQMRLNDSIIGFKSFRRYGSDSMKFANIPLSRIDNNDSSSVTVRLPTLDNSYRLIVSKIRFTYPRKFEFNKKTSAFGFELPASVDGNLLKIVNFDTSSSPKILIDETNMRRYTAVRIGDTLWFALEPSAGTRSLVLTSTDTSSSKNLVQSNTNFTARNFIDYSLPQHQADYLIISNSLLNNDNGINQVEAYRAYRSSPLGGSYNAKVYDIDSITEQFGNNIRKHPIAIRNFLRYCRANYTTPPKAVFLLGRGATYNYTPTDTNINKLNLIPTWGHPASDNLLAAADNESITPVTSIGRLAAITGAEVKDYLDKVIEFESIQQSDTASKIWQKQTLHLIGGNDPIIVDPIKSYMQKYEDIIEDTLVGAKVSNYIRLNDPNTAANNAAIQAAVKGGTGIISYFGHSSATSIDFNLNNPEELEYTPGRLPVFLANGCKASEFFDLNPRRYNQAQLTLSERFVLAKNKGSIAFISSTHYGILQYLDFYTENWYDAIASSKYNRGVGEIHMQAVGKMLQATSLTDIAARLTAEQYHLHGDPALKIHTQSKPDYSITESDIVITPDNASTGNDSITVKVRVVNAGKATVDSLDVQVVRVLPNGQNVTVMDTVIVNLSNIIELQKRFSVGGLKEAGTNQIMVLIDVDEKVEETNEDNNLSVQHFDIAIDGANPILPQNFGIVNIWPTPLIASPHNITTDSATYRMQLDTTTAFNSPLLYTMEKIEKNGVIQFIPGNTLIPGKVYYWRTTQIINGTAGEWSNASFTYLPGESNGFNQGHYFQHKQSTFERMYLDSTDRIQHFNSKFNNLYITHGIYPTSGTEELHFSITPNGTSNIRSACIGSSIIINVFDSLSFIPFINPKQQLDWVGGCGPNSPGKLYNFEFPYAPASNRKKIMDFLDSIPKGQYVAARLVVDPPQDSIQVQYWKRDTLIYGSGNSLYHRLFAQGFKELDSLNAPRTFSFVFKKDDSIAFKPAYVFSDGLFDRPLLSADLPMTDTAASVMSPWFGPALQWDSIRWKGLPFSEPNGIESDSVYTYVLGKQQNGIVDTLFSLNKAQQKMAFAGTDSIDATKYRYLGLAQKTHDSDNATPHQLDFWRVNFVPAPEGAMLPGSYFIFAKDTLSNEVADSLQSGSDTLRFGIAFANIGTSNYSDSIEAVIHLEDSVGRILPLLRKKLSPLLAGDSLRLFFEIPIDSIAGNWKLYAGINAAQQQPEISTANNFIYQPFYVKAKVIYPANLRIFNGTGLWSDSSKWTPFGLPICTDRVIINGQATVDITDAVSDSLIINDTGSLILNQPLANLNVGCSNTGGNKLMTVKGTLAVSAGTLQVNGGLLFADSSAFYQSGGSINIDPNTGDSATSLLFGLMNDSIHLHPLAMLSFGGIDTSSISNLKPYMHGTIEVTGGSIHLKDPPVSDSGFAFFFVQSSDFSILFDTTHQLVIGTNELAETATSTSNTFILPIEQRGGTGQITFGNMIIRTGNVAGRKVLLRGPAGMLLYIRGLLQVETDSRLEIKDGLEIKLEYQQ